MNFKKWMEQNTIGTDLVDDRQINSIYDKAKYAIQLVRLYDKNLLKNISTIAPLSSSVYGLYSSGENKKAIGNDVLSKIRLKFGNNLMALKNLEKLPNQVLKKYIPDIDLSKVQPSDVIKVNVNKILKELGDSKAAIIEIASTIVHEATHELEFQNTGKTNEIGPKNAEIKFKKWVDQNWERFSRTVPQIANLK